MSTRQQVSRRKFLQFVGAGALVSSTGLSCIARKKKAPKPNIIFLLTDDQRWDTMSCMGNKIIKTPNMDALARDGVLFKNAFVTTSICCVSRASIFLGQYARRHHINDFKTDFTAEQLSQTYPMLLKKNGYRIGFIGKYGVGKKIPADRYDFWKGISGQPVYEQKDENGNPKHLTKIMGDQALEFLSDADRNKPFCLSISFKAPHVQDGNPRQFIYDPAFKDYYKDATIPVPETADPKYYEAFPAFFKKNNEGRRRWQIRFSTPEKYQESVKSYYRLITGVDMVVGKIREALAKQKLDKNTVIILLGDNGFYLGEHGLAGKWFGHEESIRVPLIIYDPQLPPQLRGQKRDEMALNIDIAPTILSLAGVQIPQSMQGRDLMALIKGNARNWRHDFLYEHLFKHPAIPKSEGVVGERFKYLRYIDQKPVYEELYDLKNDPHEEKNLAAEKEYAPVLQKMRKRCDELIAAES
ncbi:MAG: sulfatase-like hydrolase/transferase [Actinobacteria bacterium]|nr:sulfatase-like hydrolase/transferase [Actinomycetota bacterium]